MNIKQQFFQFIASGRFRSIVVDFCIVICDFLIGYVMVHYLDMNDEDRLLIVFGVPFIICAVAYLVGLLLGQMAVEKSFFGGSENDNSDAGLVMNSFLMAAFIMVTFTIANLPLWLTMTLMFLIAGLWYYLHWQVIKESRKANHITEKKYRIPAAVLMLPLMMCTVIFTNMLASMITDTHDLGGNIVMVFLMMMVTWGISFVPRRFVKAMLNVQMAEGYFVVFLLADYSLKVITS